MPQIEVSFDIDANGIMHVSAKDLGTGKQQAIQITSSSGLNEEEIKRVLKEAEMHAQEDKQRREKIDVRNQLDSLIYNNEKTIKEYGEKLSEGVKSELSAANEAAKKVLEREDATEMKNEIEKLNSVAGKAASEIYKSTGNQGGGQGGPQGGEGGQGGQGGPQQGPEGEKKDDVVDADYKEV